MATLEQVINDARQLPPADKRELIKELDRDLRNEPTNRTTDREHAWLEQHRDEYLGQWVALDGDRLLAHGTEAKEVYDTARASGVKVPFMEQITPNLEPYMGGWS